ncbi:PIN domain-containing protein [Bifidobacterium imperatoris]|uniref:PIN domain-containing protein n=1 Tax=Bifidobacterium imperatoris TaxID=2020965 RepID=A0A2N5IVG4_9BIFI|nr:PIN domain-containing protein [Bifidobacterium imperatoris]PLS25938.1 hypothetical protein Tam1G_0089 [Bifidobacterium imperatoris]QSY57596.1 PIN domain-containing protein [Bifidobacterium imperatoris]
MIDYGKHGDCIRRVLLDTNILVNSTVRKWIYAFYREDAPFEPYTSRQLAGETSIVLARIRREKYGKNRQWKIPEKENNALPLLLKNIAELTPRTDRRLTRDSFIGSDRGDMFLHSIMVCNECSCLVTNDRKLYGWLSDVQRAELGYEVMTADMFLCSLAEDNSTLLKALNYQFERYVSTNATPYSRMVSDLRRAQCPMFAKLIDGMAQPPFHC